MEKTGKKVLVSWLTAVLTVLAVWGTNLEAKVRIVTETDFVHVRTGARIMEFYQYHGDRSLMRYRYKDVPYKPYVDQLYSPSKVNILLDSPHDHKHHHALMYAITADGVNFWEEHNAPGKQAHLSFSSVRVDERNEISFASFTEQLAWSNPRSKEMILREKRTIEVRYLTKPNTSLLTWESEFEPAEGKKSVTLTGSHYHGLGLRFIRSMDNNGEFRNAHGKEGKVYRGDERLVRSKWCAYTAKAKAKPEAEGKEVTVAMFDHPGNERHPATWFTMSKPFAYLSATMNLHEQPFELIEGKPLQLRYAVAVWDDRPETEQIEKTYKAWAALPREKPKGSTQE